MEDLAQKSVLEGSAPESTPEDSAPESTSEDSTQKPATKSKSGPEWTGKIIEEKGKKYLEVSLNKNSLFTFVFCRHKILDTKEEF